MVVSTLKCLVYEKISLLFLVAWDRGRPVATLYGAILKLLSWRQVDCRVALCGGYSFSGQPLLLLTSLLHRPVTVFSDNVIQRCTKFYLKTANSYLHSIVKKNAGKNENETCRISQTNPLFTGNFDLKKLDV